MGFLGTALTHGLDNSGIDWIGACRRSGHDLMNADALDELPDCDWVVHLAGRLGVVASWEDPSDFFATNFKATLTAVEYARRRGANFIYISTYVYGVPVKLPVDENHPIDCANPYAWSKRQGETLCGAYSSHYGVPITILRPFNIYGPNQNPTQLISHIIGQVKAGDAISVTDLAPRRDWLWVEDLVAAVIAVLNGGPEKLQIFNVGYGASISVEEIIDLVLEFTGEREVICRNEERPNEIPDCVCDATAFRKKYGWAPRTDIRTGISELLGDDLAG